MLIKQFAVFVALLLAVAILGGAALYASFHWPVETIAGLFLLPALYVFWIFAGVVIGRDRS